MATALSTNTPPYGGFWVRFAAHFVDNLIVSVIVFVVLMIALVTSGMGSGPDAIAAITQLLNPLILLFAQLYHAYFVSSEAMATPGKRMCGLTVTDVEGKRLGFLHALGRNVCAALSYLTLMIGFIMAGFTVRKQTLHDKLTGTLVHRQPGSGPSKVVRVLVTLFVTVFVLGILAGIFIPAYQDYVKRTQAAQPSNLP